MRTGIAHLPLHGGRAPRWLFDRMVRLSREAVRHVAAEHGPEEMLRRERDLGLHVAGGAAELIDGTPASARDPARFSFAHGGKDGHPYPVDRETYDHTIDVLRHSVDLGRLDHSEKVAALKRLASFAAHAEAS